MSKRRQKASSTAHSPFVTTTPSVNQAKFRSFDNEDLLYEAYWLYSFNRDFEAGQVLTSLARRVGRQHEWDAQHGETLQAKQEIAEDAAYD